MGTYYLTVLGFWSCSCRFCTVSVNVESFADDGHLRMKSSSIFIDWSQFDGSSVSLLARLPRTLFSRFSLLLESSDKCIHTLFLTIMGLGSNWRAPESKTLNSHWLAEIRYVPRWFGFRFAGLFEKAGRLLGFSNSDSLLSEKPILSKDKSLRPWVCAFHCFFCGTFSSKMHFIPLAFSPPALSRLQFSVGDLSSARTRLLVSL